jgi:hypothetical protein
MAVERALLVIADIGGYTRFMQANRATLAHAQELIATLLEAVLDSATGFELAKLEGDAAFLFLRKPDDRVRIDRQLTTIRSAFLNRKADLMGNRLCTCEACVKVDELTLKFVAHEGEIAFQRVKRHTELAGVDVILVHRLLKNDVPLREYVLMTDAARARLEPELHGKLTALVHDLEGLGATQTHFLDLTTLPIQTQTPHVSLMRKVSTLATLSVRSLPHLFGPRGPNVART